MPAKYDRTAIMDYLRKQPDINPDAYDGSYELLRETVRSYISVKENPILDYHDLNALYLMVIGTWKHGIERKKIVINDSHLPEEEKARLLALITRIWNRVCARGYLHQRDKNPPRMGMFGTGFMTFKGKAPDHCARDFVRMCAEIFPLTDEEDIFQRVEQVLTPSFRGMQAGSVSMILHCMKPDVFPILNGNMGTDSIFEALGIWLRKPGEYSTYIDNCRTLRRFRDDNFSFRNYRVFDITQHYMIQFLLDNTPQVNTIVSEAQTVDTITGIPDTDQAMESSTTISSATGAKNRKEKRIVINGHEYIVYGVDAASDGNGYPHMVDAVTGLTPHGDQRSLLTQYLISRGVIPSKKANAQWCCNTILTMPDDTNQTASVDALKTEEKMTQPADNKIETQRTVAMLKQMPYEELRELFVQWAGNLGMPRSSYMTFVSDCFFLWRKEGPEQFWQAVESDESIRYDILHRYVRKYSTGDIEQNTRTYCRAIDKFHNFISFWIRNEENVIADQTGRSKAVQIAERPSSFVPGASGITGQHTVQVQPVTPVKSPELSNRLEKKLDSLLGAIATMHAQQNVQVVSEEPKEIIADKRFRIEATDGSAPVLMLSRKPVITGLVFTLKLCAVGLGTDSERYRIFFANENGEVLSKAQEINAVTGEEYPCRFELKSSASEEKTVFLAVQGVNAEPDAVRQLIKFSVKIAFAADFGL